MKETGLKIGAKMLRFLYSAGHFALFVCTVGLFMTIPFEGMEARLAAQFFCINLGIFNLLTAIGFSIPGYGGHMMGYDLSFGFYRFVFRALGLVINLPIRLATNAIIKYMDWRFNMNNKYKRVFDIKPHRDGLHSQQKDTYMRRYKLIENNLIPWRLYIHKFLRDDMDAPHDHPWNFLTYVVSGSYNEFVTPLKELADIYSWRHSDVTLKEGSIRKAGQLSYRPAEHIHVIRLLRLRTMMTKRSPGYSAKGLAADYKPCITIMLTFSKKRSWYFYENVNKSVHKTPWRQYLGMKPEEEYRGEG